MAEQKLKNHSGASKRFKWTGRGKLVRRRAGMRHILTTKARDRKRRLGRSMPLSKVDAKAVEKLLPYR
ncbi:MAG: 50S ribosomal protein L35 [Nitrospirae bacterium]|nr:MAG: 50S ribosomal protein L35 [Nitrospirota bacterium]